jgi:hypothetical protein
LNFRYGIATTTKEVTPSVPEEFRISCSINDARLEILLLKDCHTIVVYYVTHPKQEREIV